MDHSKEGRSTTPARSLGRAGALASAALAGHGLGLWLMLGWLEAHRQFGEGGVEFVGSFPHSAELLHARYPEYVTGDGGAYILVWLVFFATTAVAGFAARRAPVWMAARGLGRAPDAARGEIRAAWRGVLGRRVGWGVRGGVVLAVAAAAGLVGCWVGGGVDAWRVHRSTEAAWARGNPGLARTPGPMVGTLGAADGAATVGVLGAAAFWSIVGPARRRGRTELAGRWCVGCGYPVGGAGRCPECGARDGRRAMDRGGAGG